MFYYLVGALKRRLILELKDSFAQHPLYAKIVPFIQNRFSFQERPQFGIVVKGSSTNKVQFSPDNFVGTVISHVMLAYVGAPKFPIEWVKEDTIVVRDANGMPTLAGIYYLEILEVPTTPDLPGYFAIDPLLTVTDESVLLFQTGNEFEGQLQQIPVQNTVRLYENRRILLVEGEDYTVDYQDGKITFIRRFAPQTTIIGDYRYATDSIGPREFYWNKMDNTTLPGVVLAFGKRASKGDKVAVVVYQNRTETAEAFGGKFEVSFDLDVIARDTTQMEEIADLSVMYLWAQKKSLLEFEGIEIIDINIGGEAEETADETGENFYYTASLSIQLRADWEIHVPLPLTISRVSPGTTSAGTGLTAVSQRLFYQAYPIVIGRNNDYERIA